MLPRTSPVSKSWLPLSKAACPLPVILRSCTDTTYWCVVACGSACPRQTLAEDRVAKEIRRVVGKKLWNLLPNRKLSIATCSRAGKSSPVIASILERKWFCNAVFQSFVQAEITVRTSRGVNCPPVQAKKQRALPRFLSALRPGYLRGYFP